MGGRTYSVGSFTAALQPHARSWCHRTGRESDSIVPANLQSPRRTLGSRSSRLDEPPVFAHTSLGRSGIDLRQERPSILEHVQVCSPLVSSSADDQVHLEVLFIKERAVITFVVFSSRAHGNLDAELVALFADIDDFPPGQEAMRPLLLVHAERPSLVVHLFVQVLNQLKTDHAVVGGACVLQNAGAVGRWLGVDGVDVGGVEDGVDAGFMLDGVGKRDGMGRLTMASRRLA